MNKRVQGAGYEKLAADYLSENGVRILERNFRCRKGEIDLIGMEEKALVFFEVKYRKNENFGKAVEAVDRRKQAVICAVSDFYRCVYKNLSDYQIRYDVIAFQGENLKWIKNAFGYIGKGF